MTEQIDLQDPLSNPQVAAAYWNKNNLPSSDPEVVAAKKSVQEYYEKLTAPTMVYSSTVEDQDSTGMGEGDDPTTPVESYDLVADLGHDGYVGLVPELVAEMTPKLYETLDTYGGRDSTSVQKMAVAMGEMEGAKAWAELEQIAIKHPDWAKDKKLRAKVLKLNQTVDAATLRIFTKLG